jgi:hypothetical protein
MTLSEMLQDLRGSGWLVAVHNDYKKGPEFWTFWLFTNKETGTYYKGEGMSDEEAVRQVRRQVYSGKRED